MKTFLTTIAAAAFVLAAGSFATQAAEVKTMNAEEVAAMFKKGSKVCCWKAGKKGRDKGTDYYYKDMTATSGNADRVLGKTTLQGKWSVSGDTLSLQFGVVGKALMYKLAKVDKKSFTAYLNGKKKMTFTCK